MRCVVCGVGVKHVGFIMGILSYKLSLSWNQRRFPPCLNMFEEPKYSRVSTLFSKITPIISDACPSGREGEKKRSSPWVAA